VNGISALLKETRESPHLSYQVRTKEGAICKPENGSSPDVKTALILDFSASRYAINKFLLFITYSIYGIIL
jgi:hypothetical protein